MTIPSNHKVGIRQIDGVLQPSRGGDYAVAMSDDPIEAAVELLRRGRTELATKLAEIDRALESLGYGPARSEPPLRQPSRVSSLRDQILAAMPESRVYTTDEIVTAVEGQDASVRSVISRMVRAGDLTSPARGAYVRPGAVVHLHDLGEDREEVSGETDESDVLPNVTQDDRLT